MPVPIYAIGVSLYGAGVFLGDPGTGPDAVA
jgi:hypothetical protein